MKTKKNILCGVMLVSAILFQQCGSDEPAAKKITEVYIGGELNINAGNWAAAFMKNGVMDTLENGDLESGVIDITGTKGGDIYMSGFVGSDAAYWKNGEVTVLPSLGAGFWDATASNIFIKGNDIYLAGRSLSNNGSTVVYWKNGVLTQCGLGYPSWNGCGLAVSDANDVYIAGFKEQGNLNNAGYWKNGNWNLLSDPLVNSYATGLAIDGNDIYVVGYYVKPNGWTACYWKNGNLVDLSGPGSSAYDIKIVNGDIYIAGNVTDDAGTERAVYWKNGEEVRLTNTTGYDESYGYAIQVKNNDVYVSGEVAFPCDYLSVVWKNGEMVAPLNGNQACDYGDFYTIYVR